MRVCSKCKATQFETEFGFKNKKLNILKHYCKSCEKVIKDAYYQSNKSACIADANRRRLERREKFQRYKETLRCECCGEKDSICLDFHHLEEHNKEFTLSEKAYYMSWESLMNEINKCICVCANCHRKIHKYGLETVRGWYSGCALAFQANETSSILVPRSN